MTPYQRGNRDGCLSLAEAFCRMAEAERERADSYKAMIAAPVNHVQRNAANVLLPTTLRRMEDWRTAERMARCAAEALPDDPGAP